MKSILLVRHGQSQEQSGASADGMNPGLSELGVRQSRQLGQRLVGLRFDRALISPLDRAYQTYSIAAPQVASAEFDARLIEVDYVEHWYRPLVGYLPEPRLPQRGADAWLTPVERRAEAMVGELCAMDEERILLFGHQGIFKQIIAIWLGLPAEALMRQLVLGNTSLTGLGLTPWNERILYFMNDVRHLADHEGGLRGDLTLPPERLRPWRAGLAPQKD